MSTAVGLHDASVKCPRRATAFEITSTASCAGHPIGDQVHGDAIGIDVLDPSAVSILGLNLRDDRLLILDSHLDPAIAVSYPLRADLVPTRRAPH